MTNTSWAFGSLRMFGYDVICCDPPWSFALYNEETGARKSAAHHYRTMPLDEIKALRVGDLACGDCLLLLWATGCMLPEALDVMAAWGFAYKSEIVWRKVTRRGRPRMGTGYRVRTMHEPILVGTIGNPRHKPFPSCFDGVAREHSRKPVEFYDIVRRCTPMQFRCDLFSRETHPDFDGWGDEHGKFDQEAA